MQLIHTLAFFGLSIASSMALKYEPDTAMHSRAITAEVPDTHMPALMQDSYEELARRSIEPEEEVRLVRRLVETGDGDNSQTNWDGSTFTVLSDAQRAQQDKEKAQKKANAKANKGSKKPSKTPSKAQQTTLSHLFPKLDSSTDDDSNKNKSKPSSKDEGKEDDGSVEPVKRASSNSAVNTASKGAKVLTPSDSSSSVGSSSGSKLSSPSKFFKAHGISSSNDAAAKTVSRLGLPAVAVLAAAAVFC